MISQSPCTSNQPLFSITEFGQICRLLLVELVQCLKDPGVLGPDLSLLDHHCIALLLGLELKVTHFPPELDYPELILVCAGLRLLQLPPGLILELLAAVPQRAGSRQKLPAQRRPLRLGELERNLDVSVEGLRGKATRSHVRSAAAAWSRRRAMEKRTVKLFVTISWQSDIYPDFLES